MALDQEKELMETTLRHIAFGEEYISPPEMIRLAAKALGQVSEFRLRRMLKQAEAKIALAERAKQQVEEDDGIEIELNEIIEVSAQQVA